MSTLWHNIPAATTKSFVLAWYARACYSGNTQQCALDICLPHGEEINNFGLFNAGWKPLCKFSVNLPLCRFLLHQGEKHSANTVLL